MNRRRQKRLRARMIKRIAISGILVGVVVVCVILFLGRDTAKQTQKLLHPYRAHAMEMPAEPTATVTSQLPVLFGDGLCISKESEVLDKNISSWVAAIYNRTTGEVIYSESAESHYKQASITKLMTFYLAVQYGDLDDVVTVKGEWLENLDPASSVCGIKDGDEITLEQLLYGLMMPSGNDAANAIAYHISGSEIAFVELMNETARLVGMTDTHFVNAHGLDDPKHYSSAYDIYLLFDKLLDMPIFREVVGTQSYTASYSNNGLPVVKTWNRGIWYFTGARDLPVGLTGIGGKTGTTDGAGYCLSLCVEDTQGNEYIAIILYAGSREKLYNVMDVLLSKIAN